MKIQFCGLTKDHAEILKGYLPAGESGIGFGYEKKNGDRLYYVEYVPQSWTLEQHSQNCSDGSHDNSDCLLQITDDVEKAD